MKNNSKTSIIALVVLILFFGVFAFFAWATEWFSSTKRLRELFNKAPASISETVQNSAYNSTRRNASLNYDSDEAIYTANLQAYSMPSYYIDDDSNLVVYTKGRWGQILRVEFYDVYSEPGNPYQFLTYEYKRTCASDNDTSDEIKIPFSQIVEITRPISGINIRLINLNSDDYVSSPANEFSFYKPKQVIRYQESDTVINVPSFWCDGLENNYIVEIYDGLNKDTAPNRLSCKFDVHNFHDGAQFNYYKNGVVPNLIDDYPAGYNTWIVENADNTFSINLANIFFLSDMPEVLTVEILPTSYNCGSTGCMNIHRFEPVGVFAPTFNRRYAVTKLATPSNIRYESGSLLWDAVEGAKGYSVSYGDLAAVVVNEPKYFIADKSFESGEHEFRIRALGNIGSSIATSAAATFKLNEYNASLNVSRVVVLSCVVGDDTVSKFVTYGDPLVNHLAEAEMTGKEFSGWYYDAGFSLPVSDTDVIKADTTVYARFTDVKIEEEKPDSINKLSWWAKYRWYVLGPIFGIVGLSVFAVVVNAIRKKRG